MKVSELARVPEDSMKKAIEELRREWRELMADTNPVLRSDQEQLKKEFLFLDAVVMNLIDFVLNNSGEELPESVYGGLAHLLVQLPHMAVRILINSGPNESIRVLNKITFDAFTKLMESELKLRKIAQFIEEGKVTKDPEAIVDAFRALNEEVPDNKKVH